MNEYEHAQPEKIALYLTEEAGDTLVSESVSNLLRFEFSSGQLI